MLNLTPTQQSIEDIYAENVKLKIENQKLTKQIDVLHSMIIELGDLKDDDAQDL
jgi:hypothetical protein